jgi:hypothetical protein
MPNVMPWAPVHAAARRALVAWVADGIAPPSFPTIAFAGDPPTIQRGEDGSSPDRRSSRLRLVCRDG